MIADIILYVIPFLLTLYFCYLTAKVWEGTPEARGGVVLTTVIFSLIIIAWWWATITVVGPLF